MKSAEERLLRDAAHIKVVKKDDDTYTKLEKLMKAVIDETEEAKVVVKARENHLETAKRWREFVQAKLKVFRLMKEEKEMDPFAPYEREFKIAEIAYTESEQDAKAIETLLALNVVLERIEFCSSEEIERYEGLLNKIQERLNKRIIRLKEGIK